MSLHLLKALVADLRDQKLEMAELRSLMLGGPGSDATAPAAVLPSAGTRPARVQAAASPWDPVMPPTREQRRAIAADPLDEEDDEEEDDGTWSFAPRPPRSGIGVGRASPAAAPTAAAAPLDVNAAVQLELLKTLQKMKKARQGDSDSDGEEGPRKVSGLRDVERLRRRVFS